MKYIDFIFISLYDFYSNRYGLKYSTPQGYSIYAMSMGVIVWSINIEFFISHFILHNSFMDSYVEAFSIRILVSALVSICTGTFFYFIFYLRYLRTGYYLDLKEYRLKEKKKKGSVFISFLFTLIIPIIIVTVFIFLPKK